jgi:hypothetical protein
MIEGNYNKYTIIISLSMPFKIMKIFLYDIVNP